MALALARPFCPQKRQRRFPLPTFVLFAAREAASLEAEDWVPGSEVPSTVATGSSPSHSDGNRPDFARHLNNLHTTGPNDLPFPLPVLGCGVAVARHRSDDPFSNPQIDGEGRGGDNSGHALVSRSYPRKCVRHQPQQPAHSIFLSHTHRLSPRLSLLGNPSANVLQDLCVRDGAGRRRTASRMTRRNAPASPSVEQTL